MKIEKGKWYLFNGHLTTHKPLMLITKNNGSDVRFCGFNFLGEWVDKDSYTLEELKRYGHREATPQEVESALIEEAKRRGYKFDKYVYDDELNILCGCEGDLLSSIFCGGKWVEEFEYLIKPEQEQDPYNWVNNNLSKDKIQLFSGGMNSDDVTNTQPHYDNTHGSLYKVAEQRGWNSYQFDIIKRIDRALKKGQFKEDLKKTKDLIDLWLREYEN